LIRQIAYLNGLQNRVDGYGIGFLNSLVLYQIQVKYLEFHNGVIPHEKVKGVKEIHKGQYVL